MIVTEYNFISSLPHSITKKRRKVEQGKRKFSDETKIV